MSGRARRNLMAAIVVIVFLWPLVHLGLVARYRVDPWELFGWSMYAVPPARVQVKVEVLRGDQRSPLRAMGESQRRLRDFARRRTALGSLASTEPLARAIFEEDPSIESMSIVTREIVLDPESAKLVARDEIHSHDRRDSRK